MCAARAPSTATRSGGCERRRRRPGCHRGGAPLEQRRSHGGARIPPTWVEANDEIGHGAAQSSWPATRGEGPDAAPATRAKRRGRRSPREIGRASCRKSVDLGGRRIIKKKKEM